MDRFQERLENWNLAPHPENNRKQCGSCSYKFPYPRTRCAKCGSKLIEMRIAKGRGKVHTMTVLYRSPDPSKKGPFVVVMVELSEGLKLMGNASYPTELGIGDNVLVRYEIKDEGVPRLVVEPTPERSAHLTG